MCRVLTKALHRKLAYKEIDMFTLDTMIESYTTGTKSMLAHIQPEYVRKNLISLAEKQAEFTKGLHKLTTDYVEFVSKPFAMK